MITLKGIKKDVTRSLDEMMKRSGNASYFLQRVVLPKYIQAQTKRWQTENSSEGTRWAKLTPAYKERKRTRFAAFPGQGTKTMIATSRLVNAVLLRNPSGRKMISRNKLMIAVDVDYAEYADEERTFTQFSRRFLKDIGTSYKTYVVTGK